MKVPHENLNTLIAANANMTTILHLVVMALIDERPKESRQKLIESTLRMLDRHPIASMAIYHGAQVKPDSPEMKELEAGIRKQIPGFFDLFS